VARREKGSKRDGKKLRARSAPGKELPAKRGRRRTDCETSTSTTTTAAAAADAAAAALETARRGGGNSPFYEVIRLLRKKSRRPGWMENKRPTLRRCVRARLAYECVAPPARLVLNALADVENRKTSRSTIHSPLFLLLLPAMAMPSLSPSFVRARVTLKEKR